MDATLATHMLNAMDAVRTGDIDALTAALDAGVPANLASPRGDGLLMLAAYYGWVDQVQLLAARGADVDQLGPRGQTPLSGAAFKGDLTVIEALLAVGADPKAQNADGSTAADWAQRFGQHAAFELLSRRAA